MRMRSSFVRKSAASAETGTRSGLHGQTLISMGLVDLDRLLGGGLPLGTLLLILEDAHSQQHLNFIKYFMAEGVTVGQKVAWLTAQPPRGGPAQFLPAEASTSSEGKAKANDGNDDDAEGQAELRIAWQYRKYIQQQQQQEQQPSAAAGTSSSSKAAGGGQAAKSAVEAGIGRQWCRSYDLTKSMGEDRVAKSGMAYEDCSSSSGGRGGSGSGAGGLHKALQLAHGFVRGFQVQNIGPIPAPLRGPEGVGRLVIQSLGSPHWWCGEGGPDDTQQGSGGLGGEGGERQGDSGSGPGWHEQRLVRFVQQLRQALQDTRCSALVTCPAGLLQPSTALRLQHAADAVLSLQTLSDDSEVFALLPDAASTCALLSVDKLPSAGMLAPRLPERTLHVVRNKRRRLAITAVDVDPDAEARQQQQQQQAAAAASSADGKPGAPRAGPHAGSLDF